VVIRSTAGPLRRSRTTTGSGRGRTSTCSTSTISRWTRRCP